MNFFFQAMVEIAKQSGDVIKKDNLRLERIKDDQDQHLDQIGKENQLAKSMLWGGPMSFFFEMFLLAIGVIAFLMTFFFHSLVVAIGGNAENA
mmetsp:Transcript_492/g.1093  ORF Transcript_492/g.1093 Transcript_492/m.1093 type:complete len:93 (-) Transcript_492:315-593(-)